MSKRKRAVVSKAELIHRNHRLEHPATPGSVVVYFREPIRRRFLLPAREADRMRVYHSATAELVPAHTATLLRITQQDPGLGTLRYLLDWDDVERVVTADDMTKAEESDE